MNHFCLWEKVVEAYMYEDRDDLVALKVPEHPDRLSFFVQDYMGYLCEVSVYDYMGDIDVSGLTSF